MFIPGFSLVKNVIECGNALVGGRWKSRALDPTTTNSGDKKRIMYAMRLVENPSSVESPSTGVFVAWNSGTREAHYFVLEDNSVREDGVDDDGGFISIDYVGKNNVNPNTYSNPTWCGSLEGTSWAAGSLDIKCGNLTLGLALHKLLVVSTAGLWAINTVKTDYTVLQESITGEAGLGPSIASGKAKMGTHRKTTGVQTGAILVPVIAFLIFWCATTLKKGKILQSACPIRIVGNSEGALDGAALYAEACQWQVWVCGSISCSHGRKPVMML